MARKEGQRPAFVGGVGSEKRTTARFGTPLHEIKDVKWLQEAVEGLWMLLDDISTTGDMARDNDTWYRERVEWIQKKRNEWLASDGFGLFKQQE